MINYEDSIKLFISERNRILNNYFCDQYSYLSSKNIITNEHEKKADKLYELLKQEYSSYKDIFFSYYDKNIFFHTESVIKRLILFNIMLNEKDLLSREDYRSFLKITYNYNIDYYNLFSKYIKSVDDIFELVNIFTIKELYYHNINTKFNIRNKIEGIKLNPAMCSRYISSEDLISKIYYNKSNCKIVAKLEPYNTLYSIPLANLLNLNLNFEGALSFNFFSFFI